jgi:molybdopterin molybdotransferase
MTEFFRVQSREEALAHILRFEPVGEEPVRLAEAMNRTLSRPVIAAEDLPPFARATMDGVAVRAQDTFGASEGLPAFLRLVGEVRMGEHSTATLGSGETVRIATGGMLPEGADAVVMVEYTGTLDAETLEVYRTVAPWENTVQIGEDVARGKEVMPLGWCLRPHDLGLLAALGHGEVWAHRKPLVAILSTGDEVVPVSAKPGPGQVRDVNGVALAALVEREGATVLPMGIVPDRRETLQIRCREAIEVADCLMLSGGSSVGTRDYAVEVLAELEGAQILAHGIAVRPGKPTLLARVGEKPLLGLPGHPVSALVIFHILGRPLLDRLSGRTYPHRPRSVRARLTRNLASAQGREDYVRVTLEKEGGEWQARPVLGGSGLIGTLVRADGLVRIDARSEGIYGGEWVDVEVFP